jgi:flagellar export protein FliJ
MKPFRFRLATLLRLREAARDQRRARLAEALQALDLLEAQGAEIDAQLAALRAEHAQAAGPGVIDIDRLMTGHRHQVLLAAHRAQLNEQIQQVSTEADHRREALVSADRDVRVLEKLRDSQELKHRHEAEALINKQLDEIASRVSLTDEDNQGVLAWAD